MDGSINHLINQGNKSISILISISNQLMEKYKLFCTLSNIIIKADYDSDDFKSISIFLIYNIPKLQDINK